MGWKDLDRTDWIPNKGLLCWENNCSENIDCKKLFYFLYFFSSNSGDFLILCRLTLQWWPVKSSKNLSNPWPHRSAQPEGTVASMWWRTSNFCFKKKVYPLKNIFSQFMHNSRTPIVIENPAIFLISVFPYCIRIFHIPHSLYFKTLLNISRTKRAFCDIFETIFDDFPLRK